MVLSGATSTGLKTPLIVTDESLRIDQHVYLTMLKEEVVPWVSEVIEDEGIIFQQDGAISHPHSRNVSGTVQREFQGILAQGTMAPSSPDYGR